LFFRYFPVQADICCIGCVNDGSGIPAYRQAGFLAFLGQKDIADSVLKRPKPYF